MGATLVTATGNWSWPLSVTEATAECLGGGGGGGGENGYPCAGGGGKGGGYAKVVITKGAESTLAVTIGAAGSAGSGATGGSGGATYVTQGVARVVLASGGVGGGGGTANNRSGTGATTENFSPEAASIGTTIYAGGNGGNGTYNTASGAGGGSAGPTSVGGNGSGGTAGGAGTGTFANGSTYQAIGAAGRLHAGGEFNGIAGNQYGSGGSGGYTLDGTNHNGGAGYIGVCLITWVEPVWQVSNFETVGVRDVTMFPGAAISIPMIYY